MRQVAFTPLALKAMVKLCDYVESKNTSGTGYRFQKKLLGFIEANSDITITIITYPLCNNSKLAR